MGFKVQEEHVAVAQDHVLSLLNATRRHATNTDRFEWLYRSNPDGDAVLWSIRDDERDITVGFTVALPRRMVVDGQLRTAWNCADFSVDQRFRTLGLAIKLRRAAKDGVDAGRVALLYAHPNDRMAVIHEKVGHFPIAKMVRCAKVLRTAPYLTDRVRNRAVAAVVGVVADPLLRLAGRELWRRSQHIVRLVSPATFDERFDRLFQDEASSYRIIGVRDSRYLNWRYAQNPLYETHALVAESDGRLRGYLLFVVQDGVAHVKDVFPPANAVVLRDLVAQLIREGRGLGLSSVSVAALESNPVLAVFAEFGFRVRSDSSRMFAYASKESPCFEAVAGPNSWFITVGDRDV